MNEIQGPWYPLILGSRLENSLVIRLFAQKPSVVPNDCKFHTKGPPYLNMVLIHQPKFCLKSQPSFACPLLDTRLAIHFRGAALSFIKLQITKGHQLLRHLHLFSSVDPASLNFNGLLSADMPATHHSNQLLSHPRAGQLTSEVVSVDDHLSLGQLSATQLSESQYQMTSVLQCNTSSPLGGRSEEAIIELDERRTPPKIQQKSR